MFEFLNDIAMVIGWLFITMFVFVWVFGSLAMAMHVVEKWFTKGR